MKIDNVEGKEVVTFRFRGLTIIEYDTTRAINWRLEFKEDIKRCCFIPEDYGYITDFIDMAFLHTEGLYKLTDLFDIEVN